VYLQALDRLRQILEEAAARSPKNSSAQLRSMIRSYFELLESDRHLARILILEIYGAAPAISNLYGIVTSTVFTAYYLLLSTRRIERIQWVNELTKGRV
jgi:hypothetical protein